MPIENKQVLPKTKQKKRKQNDNNKTKQNKILNAIDMKRDKEIGVLLLLHHTLRISFITAWSFHWSNRGKMI